ncbi:carbohydrate ABC transporter permease [Streptomyces sp. NPDC059455]|uniref:carbohydrate ABC transporter permease n=1 Tax=Streptomyces sp. NPDC059455 TaxID=3346837 RepID=UPI00368927FD
MSMSGTLPALLAGLVLAPVALFGWMALGELTMRGTPSGPRPRSLRPWLWLTPALLLIAAVLVYPALRSVYSSFFDADGSSFIGLGNYHWAFTDSQILKALRNNVLWLVVFPVLTVCVATMAAILGDRVRYERFAKGAFIVPTAVSFAVTGVIWQLMYQYRPPGTAQTGTVNVFVEKLGLSPQPWVTDSSTSNFALIFAAVWAHVGLATIILSAAVKAVPEELVEAARIDGAGELQIIFRVILPTLWPTILVVGTTQVIYALKIFDVVYVMTNGNYGTDVIANKVYSELFVAQDFGRASAISVVLFVLASPIIMMNLRQLRREEEAR